MADHEIESPLGRTRISSPHRRAVYTVDNDEEQAEMLSAQIKAEATKEDKFAPIKDLKQMRSEALNAKNKIGMDSKKRLEILLGIGRAQEDVDVDGVVFSIQTLKDNEIEDLTRLPKLFQEEPGKFKESSAIEFLFYLRRYTLALSIYAIDGVSFDEALGCNCFDDRLQVLSDLDSNLTSYLFNRYELLKNKTSEKYSVKSSDDVKGVIEDLKKS